MDIQSLPQNVKNLIMSKLGSYGGHESPANCEALHKHAPTQTWVPWSSMQHDALGPSGFAVYDAFLEEGEVQVRFILDKTKLHGLAHLYWSLNNAPALVLRLKKACWKCCASKLSYFRFLRALHTTNAWILMHALTCMHSCSKISTINSCALYLYAAIRRQSSIYLSGSLHCSHEDLKHGAIKTHTSWHTSVVHECALNSW